MTDYASALYALYPDRSWSITGNDYATLVMDDGGNKPTQAELDSAWPQVQYDRAYAQVERERHAAYISVADPLFFKAQRDEDGVTVDDWKAAVARIRADLPEPTPPGA